LGAGNRETRGNGNGNEQGKRLGTETDALPRTALETRGNGNGNACECGLATQSRNGSAALIRKAGPFGHAVRAGSAVEGGNGGFKRDASLGNTAF